MIEGVVTFLSFKSICFIIVVVFVVKMVSGRTKEERQIGELGVRAPYTRYWAPFGLDIVIRAVYNTIHHRNYEAWLEIFNSAPNHNYTVEAGVLGTRLLFTANIDNIKAILATQFSDYGKGAQFHEQWKDFLGDGIFSADGDTWHDSRQLLRPQFIKDRVSDLECFEKHVQILLRALANGGVEGVPGVGSDGVGKGRVVDASDLFFRYTLDAATDFLLGSSVRSLEIPEQEFATAFGEVQRVQNLIARAGPASAFVPRKSFHEGIKVMDKFINRIIDRALQLSPEELATKTKTAEGFTFLHELAAFTRDRKVLRDQLVGVLLAGRDTTASSLSFTFYELARKPAIVKKLREEIIETVGLNRTPTYQELKNLKYLQNVMSETLRLYPVVPFNVRLALKDTTLPTGGGPDGTSPIGVLNGTAVGYSTLILHRRADIYPTTLASPTPSQPDRVVPFNHLEYDPSRWYNWHPKPWSYIPFNGGPRICIGQQFALTEMAYTIVRILQKFERIDGHMEKIDGGKPLLKAEIVLQPGDGVKVGFWEAKLMEKV